MVAACQWCLSANIWRRQSCQEALLLLQEVRARGNAGKIHDCRKGKMLSCIRVTLEGSSPKTNQEGLSAFVSQFSCLARLWAENLFAVVESGPTMVVEAKFTATPD